MNRMNKVNQAPAGGFSAMLAALAMALLINAAFAMALGAAPTNGQRIFKAWVNGGNAKYAAASGSVPQPVRL